MRLSLVKDFDKGMEINIDKHSGFCFGVVRAIDKAEKELAYNDTLYCLGDIVHNGEEVARLNALGMVVIDYDDLNHLYNKRILIRAHGEPPSTYQKAEAHSNHIIDATCSVVLKLQKSVRMGYLEMCKKNGKVVIFGKKGHAEVVGLVGQTNNEAIVVSNINEIEYLDYNKPMRLYAQTTQSLPIYKKIVTLIQENYIKNQQNTPDFVWYDTICRQVANREESLKLFAQSHDVIIFVAGEKSSNGKVLYNICQQENKHSYIVSAPQYIQAEWFLQSTSVGVCGATSTPMWLMEAVATKIKEICTQV